MLEYFEIMVFWGVFVSCKSLNYAFQSLKRPLFMGSVKGISIECTNRKFTSAAGLKWLSHIYFTKIQRFSYRFVILGSLILMLKKGLSTQFLIVTQT